MIPESLGRRLYYICVAVLIALSTSVNSAAGEAEDVKRYLEMLESDYLRIRVDAAKYITRSGLTDPVLFETVKEKLLTGYTQRQNSPKHMDEMAWYCKALASSGNMAYAQTLRQVASNTTNHKLKGHCKKSIDRIPVHAARNETIKAGIAKDPTLSPEENKIIAMLRSKDPLMMRDAAKTVYRTPFSKNSVTDVMSEVLLATSPNTARDRLMIDALSWMCKALGSSGKPEYKEILSRVIQTSTSDKLKKYARKSLDMF